MHWRRSASVTSRCRRRRNGSGRPSGLLSGPHRLPANWENESAAERPVGTTRSDVSAFWLAVAAAALIAVNLGIFMVWTQPANTVTENGR
jgi:hypothetical protein